VTGMVFVERVVETVDELRVREELRAIECVLPIACISYICRETSDT